ncbi:MAG TPA: hypothetical protein DCR68_02595 [Coprothermobacter sp.]|jgi:uncharacterized membrane protein required for colicin V production|nr:hypothetical protein [Coprothermobacter sp.]
MAPLDWITAAVVVYFAVSGLLSGAGALATTLSVFITVASRSFITTQLTHWVFQLISSLGADPSYGQPLSLVLSFLLFFVIARLVLRALLGFILPRAGIGRVIYAVGSVIVNGYAYLYLLNALLRSSWQSYIWLIPYFQGTQTFRLLETIFGNVTAV